MQSHLKKKILNLVEEILYPTQSPSLRGVQDSAPESTPETAVVESSRQQEWESKFPAVPIIYNAQDGLPRDVRNYVFDKSFVFDHFIKNFGLKGRTDDETTYRCCMFVIDHLKYVGDHVARDQPEFWQYPEDTLTRGTGDCEDGAILMKSLTLACGVPDWKVKVQAGYVTGGGHAYCTYIRDDDSQCILDWCYWPNRTPINDRLKFRDEPEYFEIWFSFNKGYAYAEKRLTYSDGKVQPDRPPEEVKGPAPATPPAKKPAKTIAEIRAGRRKNLTT